MTTMDWAPVHEWHRAVNDQDLGAARGIADPGIRVGGPQGQAEGVETFVAWVQNAGIRLVPVSWHPVDADRIVVEQDATWPGRAEGVRSDPEPVRTATLFTIRGDRVAAALRYDGGLHAALRAAGDSPG